ncbi:glycosyltransferase family 4 protein [Accumulibacter sp.]|uniref:glycosyltransferase family 4 protein n=1 Tax=Accumulibacter sp. TaxID=2053492 RepID=UPI002613BDAD|nr:glycosyltransferase family 4 protein [Accumulibacter sp.]
MTHYLFIHQNFPGQFPHIVRALAERGNEVVAVGEARPLQQRRQPHPKVRLIDYPSPKGAGANTHHYLRSLEAHVRRGQEILRVCQRLIAKGFQPDIVVTHPGWGEALFLREAFPRARIIHYLEFFYRAQGADVGFDPEFPDTLDDRCRVRVKNSTQLLSFEGADAGISPTAWQKSRYPADWQPRIAQCHDGIDTRLVCPDLTATIKLSAIVGAGGTAMIALTPAEEVVTYVARNLEPYRGFHTFMRALPNILEQRPNARILIVGGDEVSYGRPPEGGGSFRERYSKEWGAGVNQSRVHFLGKLPYADYLRVLQISSLHVYLTYPFVLSWSMLEAMSAGCLVLGSATPPVMEVIREGENGFLADFFDAQQLARRVTELLAVRNDLTGIRHAARDTIRATYDLDDICLPQMLKLLSPA